MLVGTGDIRTWLALPAEDKKPNQKLSDLSQAIQKFIENQCYRTFEAKLYKTDPGNCYFDGTRYAFLFLPQYPVWYVNEVCVDADRSFGSATQIATDDIILYEKEGKIVSEAGYFTRGRRNVRVEYYAGFAAGTHISHDGQGTVGFAVPYDLKQVIIEMVVQSFKEGITGVHTVAGVEETRFIQMLSKNSMWKSTIYSYKNMGVVVGHGYYA